MRETHRWEVHRREPIAAARRRESVVGIPPPLARCLGGGSDLRFCIGRHVMRRRRHMPRGVTRHRHMGIGWPRPRRISAVAAVVLLRSVLARRTVRRTAVLAMGPCR